MDPYAPQGPRRHGNEGDHAWRTLAGRGAQLGLDAAGLRRAWAAGDQAERAWLASLDDDALAGIVEEHSRVRVERVQDEPAVGQWPADDLTQMSIPKVQAWVGESAGRAKAALGVEAGRPANVRRKSLIEWLERRAAAA